MEFDWETTNCTSKIGRLLEEEFLIQIWEFLHFLQGFKLERWILIYFDSLRI
jgi:hypothetical protein